MSTDKKRRLKTRTVTKNVTDNKTYNILAKGYKPNCKYCSKEGYGAYCGPSENKSRQYKTWKHTRKTQYKQ
jgi:hypothetical protein